MDSKRKEETGVISDFEPILYEPPKLKVYGTVAALTAAGTANPGEVGNNGAQKRP